jgi:hypothetical protein
LALKANAQRNESQLPELSPVFGPVRVRNCRIREVAINARKMGVSLVRFQGCRVEGRRKFRLPA